MVEECKRNRLGSGVRALSVRGKDSKGGSHSARAKDNKAGLDKVGSRSDRQDKEAQGAVESSLRLPGWRTRSERRQCLDRAPDKEGSGNSRTERGLLGNSRRAEGLLDNNRLGEGLSGNKEDLARLVIKDKGKVLSEGCLGNRDKDRDRGRILYRGRS